MTAPTVIDSRHDIGGSWRITVTDLEAGVVDITTVRGVTTLLASYATVDPFGPSEATLTFPGLTIMDALGENDLFWWKAGNSVDIRWLADVDARRELVRTEVVWEGYIAGESISYADDAASLSMTCKGALLMADNTLAVREFPQRPLSFEYAIGHALARARDNGARLSALRVEWPSWWTTVYAKASGTKWWMVPVGPVVGQPWSGMVTRETGQNDPTVSSYIQGLLASMHTERGQFTLDLDPGRRPVLRHRNRIGVSSTAMIDVATPGFSYEGTCDYESKANVVFGSGRSLDGISFSNMQYTMRTGAAYYTPFAASRSVYPPRNPAFDPTAVRREVWLQFYEGMDAEAAAIQARDYQRRFAVAGHVGTITLTTDPYLATDDGRLILMRHTIKAGDVLRVRHFRGRTHGVQFLVTAVEHDIVNGTTRCNVDTVFRDHLTSSEVRMRGRDALTTAKLLTVGNYSPTIRDQLLPWGPSSGFLPVASTKIVDDELARIRPLTSAPFPWDEMTKRHPPRDARWASGYVRLRPTDDKKLANNWSTVTADHSPTLVQLSQAGSIALLQIMAVDANGVRMRVPFHVSFYYNESTCAADMPLLDNGTFTHPRLGLRVGPYPFFPGAFEKIRTDGTLPPNSQLTVPASGVGLIAAFGGYDSPAGYYPGSLPSGSIPTGLLSVEAPFGYDVADFDRDFDPYDPAKNSLATAGIVQVMIYCDSVWSTSANALVTRTSDVYFIGRLFRTPPGSG